MANGLRHNADGSYTRVDNGKEYLVTQNDSRYNRIANEYQNNVANGGIWSGGKEYGQIDNPTDYLNQLPSDVLTYSNGLLNGSVSTNQGGGGYRPQTSTMKTDADYYADLLAQQQAEQRALLESMKAGQISSVNRMTADAQKNAYIQKMQGDANLNTVLAGNGLTGGMAESTALGNQASYGNTLTDLENNKVSSINSINQAGDQQALQLALANADKAIAQANADRAYQYQLERDAVGDKKYTDQQNRADLLGSLGAYYNDFAAEINKIEQEMRTGDTDRQWLIPYLQQARQQKIQEEKAQQAAQTLAVTKATTPYMGKSTVRSAGGGKKATKDSGKMSYGQLKTALTSTADPLKFLQDYDAKYALSKTDYNDLYDYASGVSQEYQNKLPEIYDTLKRWYQSLDNAGFMSRTARAIDEGQMSAADVQQWMATRGIK